MSVLGTWLDSLGISPIVFPLRIAEVATPSPTPQGDRHAHVQSRICDWLIQFLEGDIQRLALRAGGLPIFTDA
jgi:hypothetical protein